MSSMASRAASVLLSSRTLVLGALAAGAVAGTAFLSSGSQHQVQARFTDADGLVAGNEIRVAGIPVGSVDSVQVEVDQATGKQFAVATLDIDDAHWPLHKGTQFAVRPKGVLSNVFVAFTPGPAANPVIDSGHVFGLDETSSPINLDEFSNLFNADVRESLRTQIQEGVIAFGGSGADNTNGLLHQANPLSSALDPVTAVLAQRSPELHRLNAEWDTLSGDLAREDSNLRGLIENGNTFLSAIATHAAATQGTLVHAAGTLTSLDQTLKGEEGNLATIFRKGPVSLEKQQASDEAIVPALQFINPYIHDLNQLLSNLVSVSGWQDTMSGVYTQDFRVDLSVYSGAARNAFPCGGQPDVQETPHYTCPFSPPPPSYGNTTSQPFPAQPTSNGTSASTNAGGLGLGSVTGPVGGAAGSTPLAPQFSELFG